MKQFNEYIDEYRKLLEKGAIQTAYRGLIEYMLGLKAHFTNKYPEKYIISGLHQGYMDITYFTIKPESLKGSKLRFVVVFNHENFQFEVCLVGQNKQIQEKYWNLLKSGGLNKYNIPSTPKDVAVEGILIENPDFSDLESLTKQIETNTMKFIKDICNVLDK